MHEFIAVRIVKTPSKRVKFDRCVRHRGIFPYTPEEAEEIEARGLPSNYGNRIYRSSPKLSIVAHAGSRRSAA